MKRNFLRLTVGLSCFIILAGVIISAVTVSNASALPDDVLLGNPEDESGEGGSSNEEPYTLTTTDIEVIRQNVLNKSIYDNLKICYDEMNSRIEESSDTTWSNFDSKTFFSEASLKDEFLHFPYNVGTKNQSSCPGMITGWTNNWFTSIFSGTPGSFTGVLSAREGVEVPDRATMDSEHDVEKTRNFLKNIGYRVKDESDPALDGKKCFYFQAKIDSSVLDQYGLSMGAGRTFETQDFCARLDSNGNIASGSNDDLSVLTGNNEIFNSDYDGGHLTDTSDKLYVLFHPDPAKMGSNRAETPNFRGYNEDQLPDDYKSLAGKKFLNANIAGGIGHGNGLWVSIHDSNAPMGKIGVQFIEDAEDARNTDYCKSLGYEYCFVIKEGWPLSKPYPVASLTVPGSPITLEQYKARLKRVLERMKTESGNTVFDGVTAVDYTPVKHYYEKDSSPSKYLEYFVGDVLPYKAGWFTDAEKYILYWAYLKDVYGVTLRDTPADEAVKVQWLDETTATFAEKYIYVPFDSPKYLEKSYILNDGNVWDSKTLGDWKQIAEALGNIDVAEAFSEAATPLDPIYDPDGDGSNAEEAKNPCLSNAGSLGWVLCPVLDFMASTVETIYDAVVENWLVVSANEVGAGTRAGWEMFRDFANIAFVIALVVVVLSQVTGLGLSNYGIKKMLPTLIIVAVLVNLSFIFCQIAVDLSNIIGSGVNDLFVDMSGLIGAKTTYNSVMETLVGGSGMGIFTTAVAAGGIIWAFTHPGVWLIPLLLVLITTLFSILFFFIVLAVRKAGIIVLIVLAPGAIVCYALPNTKKFFSKWLKMFTSLLVVYPICGLMMGGGQFVSSLLLSNNTDGILYNLVAMLVQVVPFFFIPTVLKGSLQAMGNLGAKISTLGQRWGNRLAGRMGGSELAKDFSAGQNFRDIERRKRWGERLQRNRFLGKAATWASNTRAGQAINAANQRSNARAIAAYRKRTLDNIQNEDIAKNTNAASIQAEAESMRMKQQQALVSNAADSIVTGGLSYQDASGSEVKIDANNLGDLIDPDNPNSGLNPKSLKAALAHFMKRYDDSGGQDEDAAIKAQAVMQVLMDRGGDKGQTIVTEALKQASMNADGTGKRTLAATNLSEFATRNGKWMSNLKSTDRGAFSLVGDLAQNNRKIRSSTEYATAGARSINPSQIPGLSDGYFDSLDKQIARGTFAADARAREDLLRLDETFQQAVRDPRVAQSLKPETLDRMNKIHEEAQKYRYDDWAKNEWAKDEWRKDQYVHDQIAENAWRTANGRAANYTLNDDEKVQAQQDYAAAQWRADNGKAANYALNNAEQAAALNKYGSKVMASDAARAATMRSSLSSAQVNEALSGYQEMTGAQVADAKKNYKGSMTDAQIQDAQTKYTHDDFVSKFGNNAKLEIGKEVKVPRREASMPAGWMRGAGGVWVDMSPTGAGRQLTLAEQRRAEAIEKHNIDAQIENEVNGF